MVQHTELTRRSNFILVLAVLWAFLVTPMAPDTTSDMPVEKGQAEIIYLCHSGWAVKTASAFLIFDYWERTQRPEKPSLSNGFIDPEEIRDQNVYVFVSHRHGDHYDERIWEWRGVIPKLTYVFGWQGEEAQGHEAFGKERTTMSLGPLKIKNIFHDFDGIPESAFLIEVDGLVIYFSGDHGNSGGALHPVYKDNIDFMSQQAKGCDFIFLSIFGSPTYDGELYAIDKFKPRMMLPMHFGGSEGSAKGFVQVARAKFPKVMFWYPMKQGDSFTYKK